MTEDHIGAETQGNDTSHHGNRHGWLDLLRIRIFGVEVAGIEQGAAGLGAFLRGQVGIEIATGDAPIEIGDEAGLDVLFKGCVAARTRGRGAVPLPYTGHRDDRGAEQGAENREQDHRPSHRVMAVDCNARSPIKTTASE
jgi:hypothetical protein